MGRLFGTDGVRGVANSELTPELAFNLGKAGAFVLSKDQQRPVVLIAKDTRISGDMLEDAISAGILAMGGNVIKVGVLPTPAVAYLVKYYKADAGVVISASHNPFEYNGIKFFNGEGFKLDDDIEDEIEDIILRNIDVNSHITGDRLGRCLEAEEDALTLYAEFLKSTIDEKLDGYKLVIDCANGASYKVAEKVLQELGAEVIAIHNEPNGVNINEHCGSTHPEDLQKRVVKEQAHLGLAFDGDADRLIAVDEKGNLIDGDKMIYICTKMLKAQGTLPGDMVTATVMSNIGFHRAVEGIQCSVETTQVGDRYVLESMLKTGCVIGGEQSGHIIFLNHTTTGDGILSALQLLKAIKKSGKNPSELAAEVTIYPQVLRNAVIKNENKKKYMNDPEISKEIKRLEDTMAGEGRVLIRPSGTEPMVRVMIEGKDIENITILAESLASLLTQRLG
ncbi:phosphoglucosamine mutase [Sinanaerobacter chloroacetimidivorans]|uniref:Phosphoglucosamine mutase n=1 Tax=Sinanaerobacter chloroacetimidivorans TaxID=2818044 RepID=A0A8J7W0M5_9FIRM|nr:phosphoglucosamine mutase [Sinanaerobacter chloroacetimidivorans]MBR0598189.1 phosphoglucosamine mutase [Sinanaerobacter chloroacetimidivorans]